MPQRSKPILQIVSKLLKVPIFPKLKFLMKPRKVLKHSNHGFLHDYEFSPSNAPFIQYSRRRRFMMNKRFQRVFQILFISRCIRNLRDECVLDTSHSCIEPLPAVVEVVCPERELFDYLGEDDSEDDSIDQKAERFIKMFYEEMRAQKQNSI